MQASVRVAAAIVVASVVGSACGKPDEQPAAAAGSAPAEAGLGSVDDLTGNSNCLPLCSSALIASP